MIDPSRQLGERLRALREAGLGGRPVTRDSIRGVIQRAFAGILPQLTFIDLDLPLIERELDRHRTRRRSGPMAENLLRDLGSR